MLDGEYQILFSFLSFEICLQFRIFIKKKFNLRIESQIE